MTNILVGKWHCSKCDKPDPLTVKRTGLCKECLDDKSKLIKVDNHYVPYSYRFESDTGKPSLEKHREDINARLPNIEWCNIRQKFKLTFEGADFGGYDVTGFVWYFDTTGDILKAMGVD